MYTRYQYEHSQRYPKPPGFGYHERDARAPLAAGNRTNLTISGTYHPARNFGYNYNGMGHMLTITGRRYPKRPRFGYHERDARATILSNYTATVTTDANGNITEAKVQRQEWRWYKSVSGTPTTV